MSDQMSTGLREEVRSRYAEAARAVLNRGQEPSGGCCDSSCGITGASVAFTHEAAPGMHSAIIRAVKPANG